MKQIRLAEKCLLVSYVGSPLNVILCAFLLRRIYDAKHLFKICVWLRFCQHKMIGVFLHSVLTFPKSIRIGFTCHIPLFSRHNNAKLYLGLSMKYWSNMILLEHFCFSSKHKNACSYAYQELKISSRGPTNRYNFDIVTYQKELYHHKFLPGISSAKFGKSS